MKKKQLLHRQKIIIPIIILLLVFPLFAQSKTEEVDWEIGDYVIMFSLLFFFLNLLWLVIELVRNKKIHWLFMLLIIILFFLIWAELAVGIF